MPVVKIIRRVRPASRPYDLRFMRPIVVTIVLVLTALNAPSTATAAPCVQLGLHPGAHALVAVRPGKRLVACDGSVATRLTYVTVPGLTGTLHSHATRVNGLLGVPQLEDGDYEDGGHADLPG